MSKCIIICPLWQGEHKDEAVPVPGDLLLCADAGWAAAVREGLTPDAVIGDFDTMPVEEVRAERLIRLPVEKDDTDLGVCIRYGRERGYHSFLLFGCLGGRLDHTLAALQLMADRAAQGDEVWALDGMNRVTVLAPGKYVLPKRGDLLLSLLAFSQEVRGVTLTGTRWELHDAVLNQRIPLGVSNAIIADEARLSFTDGLLFVGYAENKTI